MREVADAFERSRYIRRASDAFANSPPFIIQKEERAIFDDWPAQRSAKLIADVLRRGVLRGKVIRSIQHLIAQELVGRSVNPVGARLEDEIDLAAGIAAECRIVGIGQHLELSHCINRWGDRESVQLGVVVEDSVQKEVIGIFPGAVYVEDEVSAIGPGRT